MLNLRDEITCIYCWARFAPEEVLWVSEHRDLLGDPLLGSEAQLRFLPTRFDVAGNAVDGRGETCRDLACPACHLTVPRSLLVRQPYFVSILGTPSCGKSFYLAALATKLRRSLPTRFRLSFSDADLATNLPLARHEEQLFVNDAPDRPVALADLIPKTQLQGDSYFRVRSGENVVSYPRGFSFLLEPLERHPSFALRERLRRLLVFYDNAGEHFLPGQDSFHAPGTRHMAESEFLLFLFDPTQDPRWHQAMRRAMPDVAMPSTRNSGRQESVLREAANRIRRLLKIAETARIDRPLIVAVNKADVWKPMLGGTQLERVIFETKLGIDGLNAAEIERQSGLLRGLLEQHVPEVCLAAESFSKRVYYVPVSALGAAPTYDEQGRASIRPASIDPWNVMTPFLLGLNVSANGYVARFADDGAAPVVNGRTGRAHDAAADAAGRDSVENHA